VKGGGKSNPEKRNRYERGASLIKLHKDSRRGNEGIQPRAERRRGPRGRKYSWGLTRRTIGKRGNLPNVGKFLVEVRGEGRSSQPSSI